MRFHGATVHFVRHETDSGPIIAQSRRGGPSRRHRRVRSPRACCETEHQLYPLALRLIAEGQVRVEDERAIVSGPMRRRGERAAQPDAA